jgi:hypothetical protein
MRIEESVSSGTIWEGSDSVEFRRELIQRLSYEINE